MCKSKPCLWSDDVAFEVSVPPVATTDIYIVINVDKILHFLFLTGGLICVISGISLSESASYVLYIANSKLYFMTHIYKHLFTWIYIRANNS